MKLKIHTVLMGLAAFMLAGSAFGDSHDECADRNSLQLKVKENHISLKDKTDKDFPVCIALGGSFTIKVIAAGGGDARIARSQITVKETQGSPVTVSGSNSADEKELVVEVTGDTLPDEPVKYEILVAGIGILDPRIRVVDTDPMMQIQLGALEEMIENWGIGVEVLQEAIRRMQAEY